MAPTGADLVTINAVDPPGPTVYCRHGDGSSKYTSQGGWQFTKRPKRTSMTEYMGPDPYTLVVPIMFGNGLDTGLNVDPTVEALRGIMRNPVGPRNEPAVVTVTGALVPLSWLRWIIQDLAVKEEYRGSTGVRYLATYDLTLLQWEPTDLTVVTKSSGPSVAQKVSAASSAQSSGGPSSGSNKNIPTSSGWTHTVKQGETLETIAANLLGSASRWQSIASMNNIRDPNNITVGQVLRMPGSGPTNSAGKTITVIQPDGQASIPNRAGVPF